MPSRNCSASRAAALLVRGEQQHAGDRLVEPVHDAEKDVAGLVVFLLEILLDGAIQRFLAALEMRAGDAARLGDRHAVVVLVQDFERRHDGSSLGH